MGAKEKAAKKKAAGLSAKEAKTKAAEKAKKKAAAEKAQKRASAEKKKKERATKKKNLKHAKGTPCDKCLAKCTSNPCKTWCHAHWCTGSASQPMKKEIMVKLAAAKAQQSKAAVAMQNSKKALQADIANEHKAAAAAKAALARATKSGKDSDMREARADTEKVAADQKKVAADKKKLSKH